MARTNPRERGRALRQERVRKRVRGTNARPRLCVYRSGKHIYAQVISDESGRTVTAVSTLSAAVRETSQQKSATVAAAKEVGALVARQCQEQGIGQVVFDRNGFLYHGRVRALAEAAREAGLQF
ncbi:MAG: 50S ribosomal protein L18 [Deltaproteobacteria bacterium]|nr:50S ribosomal protein L18 [Deltaproteobacteria bacterium]